MLLLGPQSSFANFCLSDSTSSSNKDCEKSGAVKKDFDLWSSALGSHLGGQWGVVRGGG